MVLSNIQWIILSQTIKINWTVLVWNFKSVPILCLFILGVKTYNLGVHCNSAGLLHEAKEFISEFCWTCVQLGEQPASPEVLLFDLCWDIFCLFVLLMSVFPWK